MLVYAVSITLASSTTVDVRASDTLYRGLQLENGFQGFFGIRYALPPTQKRRFMPPQRLPKPGIGKRQQEEFVRATDFGNVCHQPSTPLDTPLGPWSAVSPEATRSEDCLFMNIYRPNGAKEGQKLPVLFWIHGGSFVTGSGGYL